MRKCTPHKYELNAAKYKLKVNIFVEPIDTIEISKITFTAITISGLLSLHVMP